LASDDGEALWYDFDAGFDYVIQVFLGGFPGEAQFRLSVDDAGLETIYPPGALFWMKRQRVGISAIVRARSVSDGSHKRPKSPVGLHFQIDRLLIAGVVGDAQGHVDLVAGSNFDRQLGLEDERFA